MDFNPPRKGRVFCVFYATISVMKEKPSAEIQAAIIEASPVIQLAKMEGLFWNIEALVKNRSVEFLKSNYFAFEKCLDMDLGEVFYDNLKSLGISIENRKQKYENIPSTTVDDTFVSITKDHLVIKFGDKAIKKIKEAENENNTFDRSLSSQVMNEKEFQEEMVEHVNLSLLLKEINRYRFSSGNGEKIGQVLDNIDKKYIQEDPYLQLIMQIRKMEFNNVAMANIEDVRMNNLSSLISEQSNLFVNDESGVYINMDPDYLSRNQEDLCLERGKSIYVKNEDLQKSPIDIEYFKKNGISVSLRSSRDSDRTEISMGFDFNSLSTMIRVAYKQILGQ